MNKIISIIFVTITLLSFNAFASLIGDEVFLSCMQSSSDPADLAICEDNGAMSSIVGADVEYPDYFNFNNSISIDISAESIWITFDNGPFCGWFTCDGQNYLDFWLTDLDWLNPDGSLMNGWVVGINVNTNMTGVLTDWDTNSVHFSLPETSVTNDMFIHIDIITDHSVVPEPSTLAIFALGLIGLASRRFKRHS